MKKALVPFVAFLLFLVVLPSQAATIFEDTFAGGMSPLWDVDSGGDAMTTNFFIGDYETGNGGVLSSSDGALVYSTDGLSAVHVAFTCMGTCEVEATVAFDALDSLPFDDFAQVLLVELPTLTSTTLYHRSVAEGISPEWESVSSGPIASGSWELRLVVANVLDDQVPSPFLVDWVRITDTTMVPIPAAAGLLTMGLLGIGALGRRASFAGG